MGDSARHPLGGTPDTAVTGEAVCVRRDPDLAALRAQLQAVLAAGIESVAVVLKHAAIYPRHEQLVGELAREMGFKQVCVGGGDSCLQCPGCHSALFDVGIICQPACLTHSRCRHTPLPPLRPPPHPPPFSPHRCRCRRR